MTSVIDLSPTRKRPLEEYYPGVIVSNGRIVRLGKLKGIGLQRRLKRSAASLEMSLDHLHGYFIVCARHQGDREACLAVLTGRRRPDGLALAGSSAHQGA